MLNFIHRLPHLPLFSFLVFGIGLVLVAFSAAHGQSLTRNVSSDPGRGEALYLERSCYACHGYNGTGSIPLANGASGITSTEGLFINYLRLRADQNPVLPRTTMPNYSEDSLNDNDARHLYAYIRSLTDTPPEVEDIPALRQILEAAEDRQ